MNAMTLEQKILARIKTENVKPTPRGWFKARDLAFWVLLALSIAALGIGIGMVIFMVMTSDLTLLESLELTLLQRVFASVPFFWIAASLALALLALVNFRGTRKGYRIPAKKFISYAVGIAVAVGAVAYALNLTDYLDEVAFKNLPLYDVVVPLNTNIWFDPGNGLLSGTVREKLSDDVFTLRDRDAVLWTVDSSSAAYPEGFVFGPGDRVRIIGKLGEQDEFKALQVHPWAD